MKICQIAGLPRSGTNFCNNLIVDNFDNAPVNNNRSEDYIWKHSVTPDFKTNPDCIIYIYKHPLMWIESVINAKQIHYLFQTYPQKGLQIRELYIDDLLDMYNTSLSSWVLNYNLTIPKINVQYERLLNSKNLELFLQDVGNKFGYKRCISEAFVRDLGDTYMSGFDYPDDHLQKYKQLKCNFLSSNEQEYIINNVNKEVLRLFN